MKRGTTKRTGSPVVAGHSRHLNVHKKGLPYTLAETDPQVNALEWAAERAAALVSIIMPEDGFEQCLSSDEVGAALAEIVSTLTYARDLTDRENMHTALAEAIFNKTATHAHELSDFYRRRLIFPPRA